jgi:hypothetical protein
MLLHRGGLGSVRTAVVLLTAMLAACGGGYSTVRIEPSPSPSPTTAPSASPTASPGAGSGGEIVVGVPTPAPVLCTPVAVSVPVGQRAVLDCTSPGYNGPFTLTLSDPAVASVQVVAGTYTFFYVNGLKAGMTELSFTFSGGGSGSVQITVTP